MPRPGPIWSALSSKRAGISIGAGSPKRALAITGGTRRSTWGHHRPDGSMRVRWGKDEPAQPIPHCGGSVPRLYLRGMGEESDG